MPVDPIGRRKALRLEFDFVVIGAGMAGASIAAALAPTARVALLESEAQPGYHTTGRSAALFVPSYGSRTFAALTRASESFLSEPPPDFCASAVLRPRGALYIARADQRAQLHSEIEQMRHAGASVESLSVDAALSLVPALRPDYLAGAAYEADVRDIDVEVLFRGFLARGRAAGVQLLTHISLGTPRRDGNAWRVPLGAQEICSRVVVNAAGAWADEVAARFGAAPLGLLVLRRSAAIINAPAGMSVSAWPAVVDIGEEFYLKPEAGRLLISPADEEPVAPGDAYPEDLTIAIAVDRVQAALAIEPVRVQRSWAGLRTFAPDREPVIGYDPTAPGFFWCAGQGGYGIQSAPAFAQLAAALARGEALPPSIAGVGVTAEAVNPARFA